MAVTRGQYRLDYKPWPAPETSRSAESDASRVAGEDAPLDLAPLALWAQLAAIYEQLDGDADAVAAIASLVREFGTARAVSLFLAAGTEDL